MQSVEVTQNPPPLPELHIFGLKVNPLLKTAFIDFLAWHVARRKRVLVTHLNLHGIAVMYESAIMTRLMQRRDAIVTIDGMSLIVLARLAGHKLKAENRVTSLDYIESLFARALVEGWRIFYVGGEADVLNQGLAHFRARYPGLSIAGHSGYFDVKDDAPDSAQHRLLDTINASSIDVLIVGMGMPRQEEWVDAIREKVDVPVIITIGAMIEYFGGSLPMPPRWLGPLGVEWAFRLATAPHRLAFRYLVEPFVLLGRLRRGLPVAAPTDAATSD